MPKQPDENSSKSLEFLKAVIIGIGGYQEGPLISVANDAMLLTETFRQVWPEKQCDITPLVWPYFAGNVKDDGLILMAPDPMQTREAYTRFWNSEPPENTRHVTKDAILQTVLKKAKAINDQDTFVIYFGGHGIVTTGGEACLSVFIDEQTDSGITLLPIKKICETVREAKCANCNKVMILDCCLNFGELHKKSIFLELPMPTKKELLEAASDFLDSLLDSAKDWHVLLSCSPGQKSYEDFGREGRYHGIFTVALAQGLKGSARVGIGEPISLLELTNYVHHRVRMDPIVLKHEDIAKNHQAKSGDYACNVRDTDRWSENQEFSKDKKNRAILDGQHPMLLARKGIIGVEHPSYWRRNPLV